MKSNSHHVYARALLSGVSALVLGSSFATSALAQEAAEGSGDFDEIVVTAEKRGESLQSIPIAITAVTGDTLDSAGITGINDLKQLAPSLQAGERYQPNLSMRGVGQQVRDIGAEGGVQVSENGVSWANTIFFDLDFLDIERVEVLRGPQGTISGRNATGGAINVYAARPTEIFEGNVKLTTGNYSRFGAEGHLSGPIGNSGILGRIAFRSERADGWLQDTLQDEDNAPTDHQMLRISFLVPLADRAEAHLILEAKNDRGAPEKFFTARRRRPDVPTAAEAAGFGLGDSENLEVELNHSQRWDAETRKAILGVGWGIGSDVHLASTTGYGTLDLEIDNLDFDGTAADHIFFPFIDYRLTHFSQELTLTADLTDRLDVIVGGMYIHAEGEESIDVALPIFGLGAGTLQFFPETELDSYAIYSQWRYRLTDDLRLTLGGRYTHDEKNIAVENFFVVGGQFPKTGSDSWDAFTPRVALDFTPSDDLTLYASASRGYKAGGYDVFANNAIAGPLDSFDPEYVWSYEAGAKWRNGPLRAALSAFYMDYTGFQARVFRPGPGGVTIATTENAASATIKGVELELNAQITDGFRLTAAGTWLDATFDEFESADDIFPELNDPVTGLRDLSGNKIPKAPEWQFVVGAEYSAPLGGNWQGALRADYQWQDDQFFDLFNTGGGVRHTGFGSLNNPGTLQEAYGVLNLRASVETEDGSWQLAAFANNVLDERYFVDLRDEPLLGAFIGGVGIPHMYGVSLAHNF